MLRIGQTVPDVRLKTTEGEFGSHEYFKGRWGLLVWYIADFSALCTNELNRLVNKYYEFESRGIKILGVSCDSVVSHIKWIEDIQNNSGIMGHKKFPFPIMSDRNRMLALYLNVLHSKSTDENGIPLPCRATFIFAPDLTIQDIQFLPQTIGHNYDEILRIIDALKLTSEFNKNICTPCGWEPNTDCFVSSKMSKEDIEKQFPSSKIIEVPSGKDYMRIIPQTEINKNNEIK